MIDHARGNLRRAGLRRQLDAIASGSRTHVNYDLDATTFDPAAVLAQVAHRMRLDSVELIRLVAAFHQSGSVDRVVEGLAVGSPERRVRSCRTVGALRIEAAVPWLTPLLRAKDPRVSASAARALGRIGGLRSADALLAAIQRRGPRRTFIVALAHAAPDLFLETALCSRLHRDTAGAIAIAAGLRRRRAAIGPLTVLLGTGTNRQRVICCRVLGWSQASTAIPSVRRALFDRDWKVRISALKALTAICSASQFTQPEVVIDVESLFRDPEGRVRKAAYRASHRLRAVLIAKRGGSSPWR